MDNKEVLKNCLDLHWLRPDNALWVYGFTHTFGELCQRMVAQSRSMDLGCGDGTTSFIMLGGKFAPEFDVFYSVQADVENLISNIQRSNSGTFLDEKGDLYNTYSSVWRKSLKIVKHPSFKYTVGSDRKEALLKKATDVGLYENTSIFDANITPYQYDEGSFNFIFSTILYWLKRPENVLGEIRRLLNDDGIFAFAAPKTEILNYTIYNMLFDSKYPLTKRLDRGRHEIWSSHSKNREYWDSLLEKSEFEIVEYKEFHPTLQIAAGETIVRTLMSAYQVLYDRLLPDHIDVFMEFKQKWCAEFLVLLEPFADDKYYESLEKTYHGYVVRKK